MKYLFLLVFLIGCGMNNHQNWQDDEFKPHLHTFKNQYKISVTLPVYFSTNNMQDEWAAACFVYNDGFREIKVNPYWWYKFNYEQQEMLIFHELGHCIFDREHDNSTNGKCPTSIMRSYMFTVYEANECYVPIKDYYWKELHK